MFDDSEPKMELSDYVKEELTINRVRIVESKEKSYLIEYGGCSIEFLKSDETAFTLGNENSRDYRACSPGNEMSQGLVLQLKPKMVRNTEFFLEEDAPTDFKETMIFHELREAEYKEAGFLDGHQRAVNDEVLYALKFMDEQTRKDYFDFAIKTRNAAKIAFVLIERIRKGAKNGDESLVYLDEGRFCVNDTYPDWILGEFLDNEEIIRLYKKDGAVDKKMILDAVKMTALTEKRIKYLVEDIFSHYRQNRRGITLPKNEDIESLLKDGLNCFFVYIKTEEWRDWKKDHDIQRYFEYAKKEWLSGTHITW